MSIEEAYRGVRATGCVYGSPQELKAQLADIAAYLGTKDPIELGAALLLEQASYQRSQLQLQLDVVDDAEPARSARRPERREMTTEAGRNARRRDRAAQAIAAYDDAEPVRGARAARTRDAENAEEAIAELICDLRHLADEHGLDWTGLGERVERYYAEEAMRHVVEVTTEGFQILDTRTEALRADVWASRAEAEAACDELNRTPCRSRGTL